MITQKSIDEVKDTTDLLSIVKEYVPDLHKRGSSYIGCCPFHDESTPSFHVNAGKGYYKCFGCGVSGGAVDIVMEKERYDFPNAIRHLAKKANITLEETSGFGEDKDLQEKKASLYELNRGAAVHFSKQLADLPHNHWANIELIASRRLTIESLLSFQVGYAPDDWRFITEKMMKQGHYQAGEELGLITRKDEKTFDTFRNRIIFPIQDENGRIVGFGGRKPNDGDSKNPKYLNSKASVVYRKESTFYGLNQAYKAIRKMDTAILVEGYYDVIMMHQSGIENTVATCGTALTESHAQKLKRICSKVILFADGDDAGIRSMLKSIDILVQAGLSVDVCELPEDEDPDSFARSYLPMETSVIYDKEKDKLLLMKGY
ncbi:MULTISPECIES: DNA primase [Olivibacter]|uniref:DNA primase n=1 Tax=Olivibacter jilunii TaxID=985016 RepID=A0ABW6AVT3_9SPHI